MWSLSVVVCIRSRIESLCVHELSACVCACVYVYVRVFVRSSNTSAAIELNGDVLRRRQARVDTRLKSLFGNNTRTHAELVCKTQ